MIEGPDRLAGFRLDGDKVLPGSREVEDAVDHQGRRAGDAPRSGFGGRSRLILPGLDQSGDVGWSDLLEGRVAPRSWIAPVRRPVVLGERHLCAEQWQQ